MGKLNTKWVALCSLAISAAYTAGYAATEHPPTQSTIASPVSTSVLTPTPAPTVKHVYKDGTFTGSSSNRRGSIEVAVRVQNGKITDVEVTRYMMHYSQKDIVNLPGQVLKNQNAQVTNVSGATFSTLAFRGAVENALSQALNS